MVKRILYIVLGLTCLVGGSQVIMGKMLPDIYNQYGVITISDDELNLAKTLSRYHLLNDEGYAKDLNYVGIYKQFTELYDGDPLNKDGSISSAKLKSELVLPDGLYGGNDRLNKYIEARLAYDVLYNELDVKLKVLKDSLYLDSVYEVKVKLDEVDSILNQLGVSRKDIGLDEVLHTWGQLNGLPPIYEGDDDLGQYVWDSSKLALLTFDDGPSRELTGKVLDILRGHRIKGLFFVLGANIPNNEDIVQRIVDEGHTLGNHSMTHSDFSQLSDAQVVDEVESLNNLIKGIVGVELKYLRVPYGSDSDRASALTGMTSVLWNVDSLDWKSRDVDAILGQVKDTIQPQSTIILHDIHRESVESLPLLIKELRGMGYSFVEPDDFY